MDALCVELEGVTKTYGPVRALVGVSATFRGGRVSAIVGPNGSGKSTLLSVVATLARPTAGVIRHGALGKSRDEIRRYLGWVGHQSLCYPELTGRENIHLAAQLHAEDPEAAFARAKDRFELGPFVDRPVRTYSRGQRQRIALARALVHRPKLILFDEPSTGLDAAGNERLLHVIREEAAGGNIVIVISHEAAFARDVAEDVVRLDRGRVVRENA